MSFSKALSIGWPGIGNLEGVPKEEIRDRLLNSYYGGRYEENTRTISVDLGNVWAFVDTMKVNDIVLFHGHQSNVHIVEVGLYKYVEDLDNDIDAMCHQREFKLLATVSYDSLNPKLQELLRHRGTVTKFKYPLEDAELDLIMNGEGITQTDHFRGEEFYAELVPAEMISESLRVLYDALNSDDQDTRIKAAIEILRYAK
jgi:predicted Mrr-cat superfamily restriction endonuclease